MTDARQDFQEATRNHVESSRQQIESHQSAASIRRLDMIRGARSFEEYKRAKKEAGL